MKDWLINIFKGVKKKRIVYDIDFDTSKAKEELSEVEVLLDRISKKIDSIQLKLRK